LKRHYCTYFDRNYLPRALALFDSVQKHENCEFEIFAVCMDEYSRILLGRLNIQNVTVVAMHDIESRDQALLKVKHERTTLEYYWTSTPTIILRLLESHSNIDSLTYLDADLFFYSSPQPIFDEMLGKSVLIHEHRFSEDQKQSIVYGKYNVGLLAFRNDDKALSVLRHWREQCLDWCYFRIEDNKIGDQKYLDDWPTAHEGVGVIQNIGAGLGPWNHIQHQFHKDDNGQLRVDGVPAIFYHFHGLKFLSPDIIVPVGAVYQMNMDIINNCFLPYVQCLSEKITVLRNIVTDFECGLVSESESAKLGQLHQQNLLLVNKSRENANTIGLNSTYNDLALGDGWSLYHKKSTASQPVEEHIEAEPAIESKKTVRLWQDGKPVTTPDDILHALRDRPIATRIRTLYVIGAFQFEEKDLLFSLFPSLQKVYLFEPTPEAYNSLLQIVANDDRVDVFPYAISDADGQSEFHISNNWQSSSLLDFGKHKDIFPEVDMTRSVMVETRKLDTVISEHCLQAPDMLFADVQGAENMIIGSLSENVKARLQLIYTEASTEELYVGSGTLADLCNKLDDSFYYLGFAPTRNETPTHGNALFVNQADLSFMGILEGQLQENKAGTNTAKEILLKEGEKLAGEGEYQAAIHLFESALAQFPDSPELLNNIGVAQFETGDNKNSIQNLSKAIQIDPYYKNAVVNCSTILANIGEYNLAKDVVQMYMEKHANDQDILELSARTTEHVLLDWIQKSEIDDTNYRVKPYKVTAIVSTYESEEFLRECLTDLVSQTMVDDIEIIVLDAASSENECAIVAEFQQRYSNIRYMRTPERIGIYLAWNIMAFMASAPYITSFSANDRLRSDAYKILYDAINDNDYALVYGDSYLTATPHESFTNNTAQERYTWPSYSKDMLLQNCMVGPHPIWRKSIHEKIGYFDDSYDAIGDQEFWCRIALNYEIFHVDEVTGLYWVTSDSLSGNGEVSAREVSRYQNKYASYVGMAS